MKLVLLGTAGGPRPSTHRAAPAQAIVHGEEVHVVDCGNGVGRQMVLAGLRLDRLAGIYITHHHADHMLDLGALPLTAWTDGRTEPIAVFGPPGTVAAMDCFVAMIEPELRARTMSTGRVEFPALLAPGEVSVGGLVLRRGRLEVRCTLVNHPPFEVALGYRFDAEGRSIVVSGDTTYSPALVRLAEGADVLVHEAMYEPALGELLRGTAATTLREHLLACHTTAQDAGRVAREAGVGTLVLSHLVPHLSSVTDRMWQAAAAREFGGEIVVGHDLLELTP